MGCECSNFQAQRQSRRKSKKEQSLATIDDIGTYYENLKPLQIGYASIQNFKIKISGENGMMLIRVQNEIKNIGKDLPCEETNAVFVQIDETRQDILRCIISGVKNTPYAYGLFLFEIYLLDYPMQPPKVKLITTGNEHVRFNPNLYNNGTVCLSLLGTWASTNESEKWSAVSTIRQVLMSIQTLVMNEDVIQKEPGYEDLGREDPVNIAYGHIVRYYTIRYAMIAMIKSPPQGFESVVRAHFRCLRDELITSLQIELIQATQTSVTAEYGNPIIDLHNPQAEVITRNFVRSLTVITSELTSLLQSL